MLALFGIMDVLRDDVKETIQNFKELDVNVRVATGDNVVTLGAIGILAGIVTEAEIDDQDVVKQGYRELDEVGTISPKLKLAGRCPPDAKVLMVKKL